MLQECLQRISQQLEELLPAKRLPRRLRMPLRVLLQGLAHRDLLKLLQLFPEVRHLPVLPQLLRVLRVLVSLLRVLQVPLQLLARAFLPMSLRLLQHPFPPLPDQRNQDSPRLNSRIFSKILKAKSVIAFQT